MKPAKATRIHESQYELTRCPVCGEQIVGKLTVEVHLGEVTVNKVPVGGIFGDGSKPQAEVKYETRMRSLEITHRCARGAVASEDEAAEVDTPVSEHGDGNGDADA